MSKERDLELVERFKAGDVSAFEELVATHQDRVYNICRHMLRSGTDAEDAAQDTFVKAYRAIGRFSPGAGFSAWITRIAVNTCIDRLRKAPHVSTTRSTRDGDEYEMDPPSTDPGPERTYDAKLSGRALDGALGRLSEKLRTVIVLKELEGLSYEEIAETLGISMGTVKSRLSRARTELRKILGGGREQY